MKTIILAASAVLFALAQGTAHAGDGHPRVNFAPTQQEAKSSPALTSEEQECLLLARRLIAHAAPQDRANASPDLLATLSQEICAE